MLLDTGLSGIPLSNRDQEMQVFQSGGAQISILMITGVICSLTWEEKLPPLLPSCSAPPPCPALGSQWLVTFLELPEEHLHVYGIRYISSHLISHMKNSPRHILLIKGCTEAQEQQCN